jgi:glycosyltransferase involved in cell wall biosynthesis
VPDDPRIRYINTGLRWDSIGAKRNVACQHARGQIIQHFDDDDWSAPDRMSKQVEMLTADPQRKVVGFNTMAFLDCRNGEAWRYHSHSRYALGTSLCYWREWWQQMRFPALNVGEDNHFVTRSRGVLYTEDAGLLMMARAHGKTTSEKFKGSNWRRIEVSELPVCA